MESLAFHPSWTEAVRAAYEDFILGLMPTLDFLFDVCFYSTPSKCRALMCVREHVQSGRVDACTLGLLSRKAFRINPNQPTDQLCFPGNSWSECLLIG